MTQAVVYVVIAAGALAALALATATVAAWRLDRRVRRRRFTAAAYADAYAERHERRLRALEAELPDWDWPKGDAA